MGKKSHEEESVRFHVKGEAAAEVLEIMKKVFGDRMSPLQVQAPYTLPDDPEVEGLNEDDPQANWTSIELAKARPSPGRAVRLCREHLQWTQAHLGEKLGVKASYVSDLENDRRAVSKKMAKVLAIIFKVSVENFV